MKSKGGSLPLLPFLLNSAIFSKTKGRASDEVQSEDLGALIETYEDAPVPQEDDRVQEMEGELSELKERMERLDMTSKSVKGDIDGIRDDLAQVASSINDLLCVYEVVSRDFNPFVEQRPRSDAPERPKEPRRRPTPPDESTIIPATITASDHIIKVDRETGEATLEPVAGVVRKVSVKETKASLPELGSQRPEASEAHPVDRNDLTLMMQISKLLSTQMERIILDLGNGKEAAASDFQRLEYWFREFKGIGMGEWD